MFFRKRQKPCSGFSQEAGWKGILAQSGSEACGSFHVDSCCDNSVAFSLMPVEGLRAEGGLLPSLLLRGLAPPGVWGLCSLGGSGVAGLERATFPGAWEETLPHPPSSGAALNIPFPALFRPQGAQRDWRFKGWLGEGNAYPEGMNGETVGFRQQQGGPKSGGGAEP